ncbi:MAG: peptidoglycan editing factor PgeF [Candidatus Sulfobium sp.]|jgi:YfiH family protein
MNRLIFPENLKGRVSAFFTGKSPGADTGEIARTLKAGEGTFYLPIQKHTDKVMVLESSREPKIADAVITRETGVIVGVQVADCVPILVYDPKREVMGAVHAGWRGTAEGILRNVVRTMTERFRTDAKDVLVAIGPGIRWCCYEVGYDVVRAVGRATGEGDYVLLKGEKYCLDLPTANKYQALSMGVPEAGIWISGECTFCNPDKYFSYRYAKGSTGRQGGFIGKVRNDPAVP